MKDWQSQAHVKWECKYHVVILPKYRKKRNFKRNRRKIGRIIRELYRQKGIGIIDGNAAVEHIHLLLSVPPKFSVAMAIGYLKGKSAVRINREIERVTGTLFGRSFWSRGYCVSTVGLDEKKIRQYIQEQEKHEKDELTN